MKIKKWIKRFIYAFLFASGASVLGVGISLASNANIGKWTQVVLNTPGHDLTAGQIAGIAFLIGLFLGICFVIWYPITRVLAWMKTRTLKNKNLEMDLKLKEKELNGSKE